MIDFLMRDLTLFAIDVIDSCHTYEFFSYLVFKVSHCAPCELCLVGGRLPPVHLNYICVYGNIHVSMKIEQNF